MLIIRQKTKCRRETCGTFSLSKKIFDRLVDGGASSPATTTPTRFYLKLTASGRKICKETIFLPGNGISLQKNRCGRAVHAAATDLILHSFEFFDKQEVPQGNLRHFLRLFSIDLSRKMLKNKIFQFL